MKKKRPGKSGRTELESCVLGVVWLHQPCSAYVVRRDFANSMSSYWTGSAGAIYPAVARLERLGLIESVEHPWGRRTRKEYTLTRSGKRSLRSWIEPPLDGWTSAPAFDPVRTRATFITLLSPEARRKFVESAIANLTVRIAEMKTAAPEMKLGEVGDYFGFVGAIYELEGRLRWLRWLRKQLPDIL